jgi:hypothetical protein
MKKFILFFLISFIFLFLFLNISPNNLIDLYVYYSFFSSFNGFRPCITLYSKEGLIKAFFSGKIVAFYNNYNFGDNFYDRLYYIKIDDETSIILSDVEIYSNNYLISENETEIKIINNSFDLYLLKNNNFKDPQQYFRFKNFSKPYIAAFYYIDDYGSLNYFREYYNRNIISIGVKTYTLQYLDKITKYNSVRKIELYIDEKKVYDQNFVYNEPNDIINIKKFFYDESTLIISSIFIPSGKHKLKVVSYDFNNNSVSKEKNITIVGE